MRGARGTQAARRPSRAASPAAATPAAASCAKRRAPTKQVILRTQAGRNRTGPLLEVSPGARQHAHGAYDPLASPEHRAVLGIEPRTSRTRSENHATRPNSQLMTFCSGAALLWRLLSGDAIQQSPHQNQFHVTGHADKGRCSRAAADFCCRAAPFPMSTKLIRRALRHRRLPVNIGLRGKGHRGRS